MSPEADLVTVLNAVCPRVYPDVAPAGAPKPYVTWQALGGRSLRNLDKTHGGKRHTFLQINTWADTRAAATTLIRAIEDAVTATTDFIGMPDGEPQSTYEPDTKLYGSIQRYSVYSDR